MLQLASWLRLSSTVLVGLVSSLVCSGWSEKMDLWGRYLEWTISQSFLKAGFDTISRRCCYKLKNLLYAVLVERSGVSWEDNLCRIELQLLHGNVFNGLWPQMLHCSTNRHFMISCWIYRALSDELSVRRWRWRNISFSMLWCQRPLSNLFVQTKDKGLYNCWRDFHRTAEIAALVWRWEPEVQARTF